MDTTKVAEIVLKVNGDDVSRKMKDLQTRLEHAKAAKDALYQANKGILKWSDEDVKNLQKIEKEINTCTNQLGRMQLTGKGVKKVLDTLDKSTLRDLNRSLRTMKTALSQVERGSEEWNTLTAAIKKTKEEIKKATTEQEAAAESFGRSLAKIGNDWVGFTTIVGKAYSTVRTAISDFGEYVEKYAEMDESMSNVRKYTGLTTEEVAALNEELKKMDTRTPREQLNALAADAGRLGIEGKEDILDFVSAADQINLALGEDLDEDAVKNIGKIVMLFGDDRIMGLKQAMLSTGSVINVLSQTSSSDEEFLMEFTRRLAGVGHTAGMTQAQIMSLASVLDEGMVNVEKGATAMQNVITALYQKPAEMARIAKLDVKEFTELLLTDGNAALLQFIASLNKADNMAVLAPMLDKMKLDGAGATQVLSTLALNIDKVRETQEKATKAFEDGNSVTEEAALANSTVQANLEKSRKAFNELRIELGRQLLPVVNKVMGTTSFFLNVLKTLFNFLSSNVRTITYTATAIAAYTLAVNASVIAAKAKVLWTNHLMAGLKKLYAVLVAHPWAAIVTVLAAFVGHLQDASNAAEAFAKKEERLAKLRGESAAAVKTEADEVQRLFRAAANENISKENRLAALKKLNEISPEYLGNLTLETINTKKATEAMKDYIRAIALKKEIEMGMEEIGDIDKRLSTVYKDHYDAWFTDPNIITKAGNNWLRLWDDMINKVSSATNTYLPFKSGYGSRWKANAYNEEQQLLKDRAEIQGVIDANNAELLEIAGRQGKLAEEAAEEARKQSEEERKKLAAELLSRLRTEGTEDEKKAIEAEMKRKAELAKLKEKIKYDKGEISERDYTDKVYNIEDELYSNLRDLYEKDSLEWIRYEEKRHDAWKKYKDEKTSWSIEDLNREEAAEREAAQRKYIEGILDEKKYQEELDRITLSYIRRRKKLYEEEGNTEGVRKETQAEGTEELRRQMEKRKEYEQQMERLRGEYARKNAREVYGIEMKMLEELHKKGLIAEEEYQKLKLQIKEKYDGKGGSIEEEDAETAKRVLEEAGHVEETNAEPLDASKDLGFSALAAAAAKITIARNTYRTLEQMRRQDLITEEEYALAKAELDKQRFDRFTEMAQAAYASVSAILSSYSQLMQAELSLEEAKITQRYDKEIEAAGENSAKARKLEEKKQKELSSLKNRYNRKMMAVEIAQAVAQTAMNALMAYGSVVKIPIVGPALAVAAAAAATAAGLIQVATIKKQHEAQAAGYYEGGFTGGDDYRREAGVVHEGEFVANHLAVNNPALAPVLRLIDHAQRTNRVASLTAADVSRTVSAPYALTASAPPATAAPSAPIVINESRETAEALRRLNERLETPIETYVVLDGPDGLDSRWRRYNKLKGHL